MKSFLALCLASFALAQIEDLIPDDLKGEDGYDETLDDIWPKRTVENVEIIAPSPDSTEEEGKFWMTGEYISIEALTGELTFEMSMTLHGPP